jgi:hypothetical protein
MVADGFTFNYKKEIASRNLTNIFLMLFLFAFLLKYFLFLACYANLF